MMSQSGCPRPWIEHPMQVRTFASDTLECNAVGLPAVLLQSITHMAPAATVAYMTQLVAHVDHVIPREADVLPSPVRWRAEDLVSPGRRRRKCRNRERTG